MSNNPELVCRVGELFVQEEISEKEEVFVEKFAKSKGYTIIRQILTRDAAELLMAIAVERDPTIAAELRGSLAQIHRTLDYFDGFLREEEEEVESEVVQ